MNVTEKDIITIAKRDNNKKRTFLLVNPLQGKHLPVSPAHSYSLIKKLADNVFSSVPADNLFIIGFAETATAIGALLASFAPSDVTYMHTTREIIPDCDYLYFTESHSHATEQKLVKTTLDFCLKKHTHIMFVEDEVTTGNTIENIIVLLNKTYPSLQLKFSITSILNGMSAEKRRELSARNISCHYLQLVPNYDYDTILANYTYETNLTIDCRDANVKTGSHLVAGSYQNARTGVSIQEYLKACDKLAQQAVDQIDLKDLHAKTILVLGTEECMYPGLHFARYLEENALCNNVFFHATTRSPILPSRESEYPIRYRYTLNSFYEESRTTYLYNLAEYDYVFIITDAPDTDSGMDSVCHALLQNNCKNILRITWR